MKTMGHGWFSENISSSRKPQARLTKSKERRGSFRMPLANGELTKHPEDGSCIMKLYYKQLYTHTFDNLDEADPSSKSTQTMHSL